VASGAGPTAAGSGMGAFALRDFLPFFRFLFCFFPPFFKRLPALFLMLRAFAIILPPRPFKARVFFASVTVDKLKMAIKIVAIQEKWKMFMMIRSS
jgi:hypothetical protein